MREPAPTVYTERHAGPSGWALAAVVFCCFVAGFALPRLLGGPAKSAPPAESAPVAVVPVPAPRPAPQVAAAVVAPAAEPAPSPVAAAPPVAVAESSQPAASSVAPAPPAGPAAKGDIASTLYERTLVRQSAPEGEIIARIPLGTEVHILERQNNWYHVKYGANKEGWIYRKSIGK